MKKVTFKGSLAEIEKQKSEWKTANPNVKIEFPGAPMRVGHRDGEDIFKKSDWYLTVTYEEASQP